MTLSVRFYKRLFLVILALMIIVPTVLSIRFGIQNAALKKQLAEMEPIPTPQSGEAPPAWAPVDLEAEAINYQLLYPRLYNSAEFPKERKRAEDTVYLTFDCSPNSNTDDILDILDEYGVKATFFLSGSSDADAATLMKRIANKGHAVGVGSYSNSYQTIYRSVGSYLEDFDQIYQLVKESTGTSPEIFRFPGGSVNAYNSGIYQELIAEMLRRGFVFFDWNVSGEDTRVSALTADDVRESVLDGMEGRDRGIVMLRDQAGKGPVRDALPGIIEGLRDQGYSFAPLTADVLPVVFSYKSAP